MAGQLVTDIIASSTCDSYEWQWQSYAGAFIGGAAGGAVLATTGSVRAANFVTGAVTTGSTQIIENVSGVKNHSTGEIIASSVCDGAGALVLGEVLNNPISNKIGAAQDSYVGKLMASGAPSNELYGEIGYNMTCGEYIEGLVSNIGRGLRLDLYYGVRPSTDEIAAQYY